jgi:hypothetical protein
MWGFCHGWGRRQLAAEVLGFEVEVWDWLWFWVEGWCYLTWGMWFVVLVEGMLFVELVEGMLFVELTEFKDG